MENVRLLDLPCTILSVGSSEEYGNYPIEEMPLQETYQLHPSNPYSVARTAQEMLAELFVNGYGMNIVLTRSFNHIGPWQRDTFVISSFVKQLVECKLSGKPAVLHTGNVEIIRDFLDVRDVVDAYYKLLHNGKNGEVYNICSGEGTRLRTIIETLGKLLDMEVTIQTDPSRIRPTDNLVIIGDNSKLKQTISWDLTHTLTDSLQDMIKYYMEVLAK